MVDLLDFRATGFDVADAPRSFAVGTAVAFVEVLGGVAGTEGFVGGEGALRCLVDPLLDVEDVGAGDGLFLNHGTPGEVYGASATDDGVGGLGK